MRSMTSLCVLPSDSDTSPQPWAANRNGRAAVTAGSFWRSDPDAAFRGFL